MKKSKEKRSKSDTQHKKKNQQNLFKKISLLFLVAFIAPFLVIGAYVYFDSNPAIIQKVVQEQGTSTEELMLKMKKMLDDEKVRLATLPIISSEKNTTTVFIKAEETNESISLVQEVNITKSLEEEHHEYAKKHELSEVYEYKKNLKEEKLKNIKPTEVIRKKYPPGTTPKLAIIIDDVSFPWQTRMMKEIPYKISPAFFPPTKGHPETVRLSHEFNFAMIHLPLEAKHFTRPEEDTLKTTDSYETVQKRIKRIKELFPHIKYYNNHTGGYYTAHYDAMDRLIRAMKENELEFVDSRTIGNSKANELTKKYGMSQYSRDVFLDNSTVKSEIREQLKVAVQKAKRTGYAIAIGHPHKNTLEVLRDSKDLLEDIELVYLNEL